VTLVAVALGAGCSSGSSGPGVANAGTTTKTTAAATASHGNPLAFSQCMRAHGIADFPDPDSQGRIGIQAGPGSDLDPQNPTFQAAQRACQSLRPQPSPGQVHQSLQNALKFSQCMRQHGINDFPDPVNNGNSVGIQIQGGQSTDLNPNNPTFQAAQKACQHFIGTAPGGQKLSTGGGGQ
jgi:hypothetical protein